MLELLAALLNDLTSNKSRFAPAANEQAMAAALAVVLDGAARFDPEHIAALSMAPDDRSWLPPDRAAGQAAALIPWLQRYAAALALAIDPDAAAGSAPGRGD